MRLKFLGLLPLAMLMLASCSDENVLGGDATGKVNISLKTDRSVDSSIGATSRAGEALAPEVELGDVSLHIVRDGGGVEKTFKYSALADNATLPVGAYTLEAYYGTENEEGFDKPYYYGATQFSVYDSETTTPNVTLSLANAMVSVSYTEAFKNYFSAYTTTIQSSAGSPISFASTETRPAFVNPGEVSLTISATKTTGTQLTLQPASITCAAKTFYNVTLDVNGGNVGDAVLTITFDDATVVEPIAIDLSDELVNAPAPVLNAKGFESGVSFNVMESETPASALQVVGVAQSGIKEVTLGINSAYLASKQWPSQIELVNATPEEKKLLTDMGLEVIGLWDNVGQMCMLKFNNFIANLRSFNGDFSHAFTMQIKDKYNKVAELPVTLSCSTTPVSLNFEAAETLFQGASTLALSVSYNGKDLEKLVKFYAFNGAGAETLCNYVSVNPANEEGKYDVVVNIPATTNDLIIWADYNNQFTTTRKTITNTYKYNVSFENVDVWTNKAVVSVREGMPDGGAFLVNGVKHNLFSVNNDGSVTITGLSNASKCDVRVVDAFGVVSNLISFTTDEALAVPNGDFEQLTQTLSATDVKQGNTYSIWPVNYQNTQSYTISEPTGWTSINNITCNLNAANQNSWFQVPSTYNTSLTWSSYRSWGQSYDVPDAYNNLPAQSGNNAMVVRNVAWDDNGTTPGTSGGAFNTTYYCTKVPTVANVSAGQLALSTSFASRPSALNGYYKYSLCADDPDEKAVVSVTVYSGDTAIAAGSTELGEAGDYTQFNVPVTYTVSNLKATRIDIMITSSNRSAGAIKVTDHLGQREASKYGAVLTVDNLTFSYN